MLSNLNFLAQGQPFPPRCEVKRLERYHKNHELFEGEHADVYAEQFKRIERVIGNFGNIISYPVIVNYQKLLTIKIVDLMLSEQPDIRCEKDIAYITELYNTAYKVAIDVSRYGDGLFYIYQDETGGKISVTQASYWYPVIDPLDANKIINHVLAYEINLGEDATGQRVCNLVAQIHYKGYYIQKTFRLTNNVGKGTYIGNLLEEVTIQTRLDDFAVIHVPNLQTSDCVYGHDDYADVDSIISEILVRIAQISKILDKHASPSVQGATSALEQDPSTGEWKLKMGNFFARDSKDDPAIEYITWDSQLQAAFKELEILVNTLYMVSEIGATLLGESNSVGGASSGTALRLKMISPQTKAKRIRMRFDPAVKKAIALCSQYGQVKVDTSEISITWRDGIPNDPLEEAQIMDIRTGRKPTISQKRAIMSLDDLDEEGAEEELMEIKEDEVSSNPLAPQPFPVIEDEEQVEVEA